jgi:hypothetical protein
VDETVPEPRVPVIGLDPYRVPGPWECVVIGGGVRDPDDSFEAAARWLDGAGPASDG